MRAVLVLIALVPPTLVAIVLQWLFVKLNLRAAALLPVWWHRYVLALIGIRVIAKGAPTTARPMLILANHASWLDIEILGSLMPLSFIAKAEVAGWPIFGLFAKLQRTVFVDRTRRSKTGEVASAIAERLNDGDAMVLFAEGTSNDGNGVLPFRSALIGAARNAVLHGGHERVWIQPLSIAYTTLGGIPMGRYERPLVAWYGDMEMFPHLWAILKKGAIDVEIRWGHPIPYDEDSDRKAIALGAERVVRAMTLDALRGSGTFETDKVHAELS
ncbi:MAG: 1-acyl-sn-glycerol-3-phosphate acyltransferase [Hyphomicrobiales bacterium]|nr:MAG: 1-acyl-sn-glycerol-3-phosphate acyltransferase [Hyphomicrobiales bacterium]